MSRQRRRSGAHRKILAFIAVAATTPWPRSCRGFAYLSLRASFKLSSNRCDQPVKHPNPKMAYSLAVSNRLFVIRRFRAASLAEPCSGLPGDATVSGRFRGREASPFRPVIQVLFFAKPVCAPLTAQGAPLMAPGVPTAHGLYRRDLCAPVVAYSAPPPRTERQPQPPGRHRVQRSSDRRALAGGAHRQRWRDKR